MELYGLQKKVQEFSDEFELTTSVKGRMLDLVSEVGELSKEVLKGTNYGKHRFLRTTSWDEEMGDIMFSLLCVANLTHVDLEKSLSETLTKYRLRFNQKKSLGSDR